MRRSFISAPRPKESRRPQGGSVVVLLTNSELYAGPGLQPSHSPRERGTPVTGRDTELRWPATHTGCRSPEVSPLLLLAFTKSEKSLTPNYVAHVFVSFSSRTRSNPLKQTVRCFRHPMVITQVITRDLCRTHFK